MNLTPKGLAKRKAITIQDLLVKVENEDWHGVADAAMDLREIEAALKVYNATEPMPNGCDHQWRYYIATDKKSCQLCGIDKPAQVGDAVLDAT